MSAKPKTWIVAVTIAVATIGLSSDVACEETGRMVSRDGVGLFVSAESSDKPFTGDPAWLDERRWETISPEQLPLAVDRELTLANRSVVYVGHSDGRQWTVYAAQGDRFVRRGILRPESVGPSGRSTVVANRSRDGLGIEVRDAGGQRQYTLRLCGSGLMQFEPGRVERITFGDVRLAHAIVPSLIGVDLVYDARSYPDHEKIHVPSMNLLTGLIAGGDGMLMAAWPPGEQLVELHFAGSSDRRRIDGLSVSLSSESFYLAFAQHAGIWRAEPLEASYLEKDTPISWKRPFEAEWIGRFYVESEDVHYPFYFQEEKRKLWGRFLRGWYEYPLWFEGDRTYVHFEKKFPPQGELLIYFLRRPSGGDDVVDSPLEVISQALGAERAAKLLDFEGIEMRPLLAHGDAVCAMTNKMQELFNTGRELRQKAHIDERADDVAEFIKLIRDRVFEYAAFAARIDLLLDERGQVYSTETRETLQGIVEDIRLVAIEDLPDVSLEEVRQWTAGMKDLARQVRPANKTQYEAFARKCRSVAGAQDDQTRELCLLTIQLMEQAAALGVHSADQIKLTETILSRSRQVLRRPTWWEPRRNTTPRSDPGIP